MKEKTIMVGGTRMIRNFRRDGRIDRKEGGMKMGIIETTKRRKKNR